MAYLLDTNVVSASRRPDRQTVEFRAFLREFDVDKAFLSAITVMEIEFGIERQRGRNQVFAEDLSRWFTTVVLPAFNGRILPFDEEVAILTARLPTADKRPTADAMIAATARHHGLVLITRNLADFKPFGVVCLNPWDRPPAN